MRRLRGLPCVAAAAGLLAGGCQLSGRAHSLAPTAGSRPAKPSRSSAEAKEGKGSARTVDSSSQGDAGAERTDKTDENPFRRTRATAQDTTNAPLGSGSLSADIGHGDVASSRMANGWDDATRALVEAELRECPAGERAELERDLIGLNGALVQKIVTMRRLLRQMDRNGGAGSEGVVHSGGIDDRPLRRGRADGSANPLGAPNGRATPRPRAAGDLGRTSPWDDARSEAPQSPPPPWFGRGTDGGPSPPIGTLPTRAADLPDESPQPSSAGLVTPPPWPHSGSSLPGANAGPWGMGGTSQALRSEQTLLQAAFTQAAERQETLQDPRGAAGSFPVIDATGRVLAGDPRRAPAPFPAAAPATVAAARPVHGTTDGTPTDSRMAIDPARSPLRSSPELQQLISQAEAAAGVPLARNATDAERQAHVEKHVHLRMLYVVAGQHERSLQAIPGIDAADQEFWQQTFWALSNYFDDRHIPERSDRAAQTVAQLRAAVSRLQETARLELRNVSFCQKISSYGSYEKFARDEFSRGQPVLLYAEVANFKSVPAADDQHLTRLRSSVAIYTMQGGLVERIPFPETEDLCRNPRRDYFHSYQFNIPGADKMSLGPHVLKLTVEDLQSQKLAECTVSFLVK